MDGKARYVIFTDLDGTLLDKESNSPNGAEPALERLQAHRVPLVFCTSQTRAEVEAVRAELQNGDPFIVENGGAIYIPENYFPFPLSASRTEGGYHVVTLGVPYAEVAAKLDRASEVSGCRIRAFHHMTADELASQCHTNLQAAEYAKQREYDEPFEVESKSPSLIYALFERIEEEGLTWTRGGRFYHVRGHHNKGVAVEMLIGLYRQWCPETITVGLGDGPNDISLLEIVDVPIVIPTRTSNSSASAPAATGGGVADHPGPRGWNQAVLQLLGSSGQLAAAPGL